MSGGHFNYCQYQMEACLDEVANDEEVRRRWPRLAQRMEDLGITFGEIIHDIDWAFSGDSSIQDDHVFETESIKKIIGPGAI